MQLDKKRLIAAGATVLVLALLVIIPLLIFSGSEELELKNFVKINFGDSYSGYASPEITLQEELLDSVVDDEAMESFALEVLGIQKEAIKDWGDALGELFGKSDIPTFSDLFTISFAERYTNVKNGDVLIANLKISSQYSNKVTFEKIEETLGVAFDKTELSIRVNSLPEVQVTKVDLSQLFTVDFGEYDGYSTPSVTVSTEQFNTNVNETLLESWYNKKYSSLLKSYMYSSWFDAEFTEPYNNLSNGDTVTVRLIASEELTEAGITLEDIETNLLLDFGTREHTFTVSGLETPKNILDIFEGITDYISYSGVNEKGHIDSLVVPNDYSRVVDDLYFYWNKNGDTYYGNGQGEATHSELRVVHNNKRLCTISFSFDKLNVCTGDVVTLTAKVDTQVFKDLGYVIPTTKIQITVPEIGRYLMDKSELTPQIIQDAKDFYANYSSADELHGIYFAKYLPGVEIKSNSTVFIRAIIYDEKYFHESEYRIVDLDDVIIAPDGSIGGYSLCDWGSYETVDAALAVVADQASHEPLE